MHIVNINPDNISIICYNPVEQEKIKLLCSGFFCEAQFLQTINFSAQQ